MAVADDCYKVTRCTQIGRLPLDIICTELFDDARTN